MDLADCSSKQNDKYNFAFKSTWPTIVLDHRVMIVLMKIVENEDNRVRWLKG